MWTDPNAFFVPLFFFSGVPPPRGVRTNVAREMQAQKVPEGKMQAKCRPNLGARPQNLSCKAKAFFIFFKTEVKRHRAPATKANLPPAARERPQKIRKDKKRLKKGLAICTH